MLFGPAYKGIPLVTATAVALAEHHGRSVPWLQPQGGQGPRRGRGHRRRPLAGRVLIVDDVITAGTAIRESVELIRRAGAQAAAVALALDRQERGQGEGARSAVQEVESEFSLRCLSILDLGGLIQALEAGGGATAAELAALRDYRRHYGI